MKGFISKKKGFTLGELLIVVSITLILCAVAVISIFRYYSNLKQIEVDGTAKQLYVAAQNHLTYVKTNGQLEEMKAEDKTGMKLTKKPSDMDEDEWENHGDDYRFIVYNPVNRKENLENSILKKMLPSGAIDDTARISGSYIIEYNLETGQVYSVFYSKHGYDDLLTENNEKNDFLSGLKYRGDANKKDSEYEEEIRENRKKYSGSGKDFHLGYYGGSDEVLPDGKVIVPEMKIKNGNKLIVEIKDENRRNRIETGITLRAKGIESGKEKAFYLNSDSKEHNWNKKKNDKETVYSVTLDDVTTAGCHFAEIFGEDFIPGEDLLVVAECYGTDAVTSLEITKPQVVNSCYEASKITKEGNRQVDVNNIRHIENLDPLISGVEDKKIKGAVVTHVNQTADIDYEEFKKEASTVNGRRKSRFHIYKSGNKRPIHKNSYYSIENNGIKYYNGNKYSISNLEIKGQNDAGMFGRITGSGLNISNLTLKNPEVQGINNAGAFVGHTLNKRGAGLSNNVAIYNSCVEGPESDVKAVGNNSYAGGFIGRCETACDVINSFSTATVESGYVAGGLIGSIENPISDFTKGCIIENSYVSGRTYGAGKYNAVYCNIFAPYCAGGFIGDMPGELATHRLTWINNCYSTASVKGNKNTGGFIGRSGLLLDVRNCYATGLVKNTDRSEGNTGSFIGKCNDYTGKLGSHLLKILLELTGMKEADFKDLTWKNNFVLVGVNGFESRIAGSNKNLRLAKKACTTDIRGNKIWCNDPHPYDEGLINENVPFRLKTVTGDTHYGDWPDCKTIITITKEIDDRTCKTDGFHINRNWLKGQNLYFTLINETRNIRKNYSYNSGEFQRNEDGTYSYSFVLSSDDFAPEDVLSFQETNEKVDKAYNEKEFTVRKNEEINGKEKNKESIKFKLGINDLVKIDVKNTYLDLAKINFQYKDVDKRVIEPVKTVNTGVGYGVTAPTGAKVKPSQGTMFRGLWILTDKNGNPINNKGERVKEKKDWIVINEFGEIVSNLNEGTGTKKYKVPKKPVNINPGEYNIYFTAMYEKYPVVTIQFGVIQNEEFKPIIADQKSQVKIGGSFKKTVNIKDVLGSKYSISHYKAANLKEDEIKILEKNNEKYGLDINVPEVYKDFTIQVIVSGDDSLYGIEYVYKDSTYDENTGKLDFKEGATANVKSDDFFPGIKGTLTSVDREHLYESPIGFKEPKWNETVIGDKHKEERRYINPNYDPKKDDKKDEWITEEIDVPDVYVKVIFEREIDRLRYSLNGGYLNGKSVIPTVSYKAGQTVKLSKKPKKTGYEFLGWELTDENGKDIFISGKSKDIDFIDDNGNSHEVTVVPEETEFVIEEKTVNAEAVWQRIARADYTVEFYIQNITDEFYFSDRQKTYMYVDSIKKEGKTGDTLDIKDDEAKKYIKNVAKETGIDESGLEYNRENTQTRGYMNKGEQLTVRADGSTVVKIFYDRKLYTLQFKTEEKGWEYKKVKENDYKNDGKNQQYGLISGADLNKGNNPYPDVYYPLDLKTKLIKIWKIDNLIPTSDQDGEQYGIIETDNGKRYRKLSKKTKKNNHWKLRYKYVETKDKKGKRYAVVADPLVPNDGSYNKDSSKKDYVLVDNYKNQYWWYRYLFPVKTGHGAGFYKFKTYEDGELRDATWNGNKYTYNVNGKVKDITEKDGYRRIFSSRRGPYWKIGEWEKHNINGKIYRQQEIKNAELSKDEAKGHIYKREKDVNGLINNGIPVFKPVKTDSDGNLYYMHTKVKTTFTYHWFGGIKYREYKILKPDEKIIIDERNCDEIYYFDGKGYIPIDLEIIETNKWYIDGKEYKGQRYKKNGESEYYGTVYEEKGINKKHFEEVKDDFSDRKTYYGKDGNSVYCELKPGTRKEHYWTCKYKENGKAKEIIYRQQRYRKTGKTTDIRTIYAISGIYGHNISRHFPVRDSYFINHFKNRYKLNIKNIGTRWKPMEDTDAYGKEVMAFIPFMPKEDISFKPDFGFDIRKDYNDKYYITNIYNYVRLNYYVPSLIWNRFEPYAKINARYGILYKDLDWYDLYGFKKYRSDPSFGGYEGFKTINGGIYSFYYTRNRHNIEYINTKKQGYGKEVYYEDDVYNNLPTKSEVNSNKSYYMPDEGRKLTYPLDDDYIFEGWYSSQSFHPEDKILPGSNSMPNGKFKVFARWVAPEKTVTIHYKEDPGKNQWKEKKIKVKKYEVADSKSENFNSDLLKTLKDCSKKNKNKDYKFNEWYYDESKTQLYDNGDGITENTDLFADYTQIKGVKQVKVRYVTYDEKQKPHYFLVNNDGMVLYKEDGKTVVTTEDKNEPYSYYTITGELGSKRNISPNAIYHYKPKYGTMLVCFDSETNEVEIEFEPVETWAYTVNSYLKNGSKKILLEENENHTYFSQIVEQAPKFDGFKLVSSDEFAVFNKKKTTHDFYYEIDRNYSFVPAGDYEFSSRDFGVAQYDGNPHSLTLEEVIMDSVPDALNVNVNYERIVEKEYPLTVNGGTSNKEYYKQNELVRVIAENSDKAKEFDHWEIKDDSLKINDTQKSEMEFKMPRGPVSIKAIYKEKHKVTVNGGKSNVKEGKEGTVVTVNTDIKDFDHWEFETDEVLMANPKNRETSFLMPNSDVKLKAVAKKEEKEEEETKEYRLILSDTEEYSYEAGEEVILQADKPDRDKEFSGWKVILGNVTLENHKKEEISFLMPKENVIIHAEYRYKEYGDIDMEPERIREKIDSPPVEIGSYVATIKVDLEDIKLWESGDINLEIKGDQKNQYKKITPEKVPTVEDLLLPEKFQVNKNPKIQVRNIIPGCIDTFEKKDDDSEE